jgi:hypothetical protein
MNAVCMQSMNLSRLCENNGQNSLSSEGGIPDTVYKHFLAVVPFFKRFVLFLSPDTFIYDSSNYNEWQII